MTEFEPIGSKIRAARLAAGLTQKELGDKAGYTFSTISRIEKGEHRPGRKIEIKKTTTVRHLKYCCNTNGEVVVSVFSCTYYFIRIAPKLSIEKEKPTDFSGFHGRGDRVRTCLE